jgi:hypothetical protein
MQYIRLTALKNSSASYERISDFMIKEKIIQQLAFKLS